MVLRRQGHNVKVTDGPENHSDAVVYVLTEQEKEMICRA